MEEEEDYGGWGSDDGFSDDDDLAPSGDLPLAAQRLYGGGGDGPKLQDLMRTRPYRGARGGPGRRKRKAERTAERAAKRAALAGDRPADDVEDERGREAAAGRGGERRPERPCCL